MPGVALDAGAVLLQAQRVSLEIARQVLEALPGRAREETGIHEAVALRPGFLGDAAEGGRLRDHLHQLLRRLPDRRGVARRAFGDGGQARLGALLLLLEG